MRLGPLLYFFDDLLKSLVDLKMYMKTLTYKYGFSVEAWVEVDGISTL